MQDEVLFINVRVLIDMVNPLRVERGRPTLDAVHLVAPLKQKLGKIGAVLTRDAGDERFLFKIIHSFSLFPLNFNASRGTGKAVLQSLFADIACGVCLQHPIRLEPPITQTTLPQNSLQVTVRPNHRTLELSTAACAAHNVPIPEQLSA